MSDELLGYYHRELDFVRHSGREFAELHPEAAARLRLGADACDDPHVERMIEAFAYLTARIRRKLDDDFPELSGGMLGVLYPHYLAPIPSMAIVEMTPKPGLSDVLRIPRGAALETQPVEGTPCRFRTGYPVELWPFQLTAASLGAMPFEAGRSASIEGAVSVLRLELRCTPADLTFAKLRPARLRFYLNAQPQHALALYELLVNNTVQVFAANAARGAEAVALGKAAVRPVGLEVEMEGMLPSGPRSFPGYRLLSEYFAFPQKFLFLEIDGFDRDNWRPLAKVGNALELRLLLDRASPALEQQVAPAMLRLGCTPIINLFEQRAEPIRLTHAQGEYRIVPDARRPMATEVHSVNKVTAVSPAGQAVNYEPFYSFKHAASAPGGAGREQQRRQRTFWVASRRPAGSKGGRVDEGTEVFLSFVDLDFNPDAPPDWTVEVETTCLNRDLPRKLPFGGGQPQMQLTEGGAVARISCLTAPTPTLRAAHGNGRMWRIVSHLSLNHLSLASADALRQILRLYDFADAQATQSRIAGLVDLRGAPGVARAGGAAAGGFCRGIDVNALLDEDRFSDNGAFLFASILERFLGLYVSTNSFCRFSAATKQRQGVLRQWPPRAGERVLV